MKAIILAGGEGTRLKPLTINVAKPAVPVIGKPVIVHIIELLKKHGIDKIAVTLKYLPSTIKEILSIYMPDTHIDYFTEKTPLGTAGSVKNCEGYTDDDFVVICGDAMTDVNLTEAMEYHIRKESKITIITKIVDHPSEYGVVLIDKDNCVTGFSEKPSINETVGNLVNTGIYIINSDVMKYCEKEKNVDFAKDIFPKLLENNEKIHTYETKDYWCDIGDITTYRETNLDLLNRTKERAFVGKNCNISDSATILNSIIGDGCTIGDNAVIENSVIWSNTIIEDGSKIKDSVLCNNITIMSGTDVTHAVLGSDITVENNVCIKNNSKIWPGTIILKESIIEGVIKDTFDSKTPVYENDGISAVGNYSPDFTVKIGAAFGTYLGYSSSCIVASDKDGAAQMISHGVKTGLAATSIQVKNSINSLPVVRWMIRNGLADGGVYISGGNNSRVRFLNNKGNDLAKHERKKLLSIYRIGDYSYAPKKSILPEENLSDAEDYYISELMRIFSCPHRNLNYIGHRFTPSQKQSIIAFLIAKMYPDAPLFAPVNSLLATSYICEKFDKYLVKCGNNMGDIMHEMEKLMHIPGVYTQYLMMTDDLAFDLGVCCLEHFLQKENDSFYTITKLSPKIYKLTATRFNHIKNSSEIIKNLKNLCSGEIIDGVYMENDRGDAHISCDETGNTFNIYVESFNEEYANDLMGDVLEMFEKLLT